MKPFIAVLLGVGIASTTLADQPEAPAAAPIVAVSLVNQGSSARMAPHATMAYVDTASSTLGAGDWHEAKITWTVTKSDGSQIPQTITLADPRPQASPATVTTREGQRGYVCWYLFETPGTYSFNATVTNNTGQATTKTTNVTVVADTRRYTYLDPVGGSDNNGGASASAPYKTWQKATAAVGNNWGLLLKSGTNTVSTAQWGLSQKNNVRIDTYGGTAPATVTWNGPLTYPNAMIYVMRDNQNVLARNINLVSTRVIGGGVDGINTGDNCRNVSIVNCTGTGLYTAFGGSIWSAGSDGFASVNCTSIDPGVNSLFLDGWSDAVILGLRVQNNQYSHVLRFGADVLPAARASVGYSDCNDNYAPMYASDQHPFKSYMPLIYSYNTLFRNGVVGVERGLAGANSDYRVFDACYFKNGKSNCASVSGGVNKVRFSGCIFELENNRRTGAAPNAPDNGYSALWLNLSSNIDRVIVEGSTVLVGDAWETGGRQALLLSTGGGLLSNSTFKNLLVTYGKIVGGQPKTFSGPIVALPASGISFRGNVWPVASGSPFRVGGTSYTASQWVGGSVPFVQGDVLESDDRNALIAQKFRPNPAVQPRASTSSVAAQASFTDYFGRRFNGVGGRSGAAAGNTADFNGDGFIDGIDYDLFNNAFNTGHISADYNGDGFVDGIDSDLFNIDFALGV